MILTKKISLITFSLFIYKCAQAENFSHPQLEFLWGTKDTTLTFGQDFYVWEWYKNASDTQSFVLDRMATSVEYWAKINGKEFLLNRTNLSINPIAILSPKTSFLRLHGSSIYPHFEWVKDSIRGELVARSRGAFHIKDSSISVIVLPPEDTSALKWFQYVDDLIISNHLDDHTEKDNKSLKKRKIHLCNLARAKYDSLKVDHNLNVIFSPLMRKTLGRVCPDLKKNIYGISNKNWIEYNSINACVSEAQRTHQDIQSACQYAFRLRNEFVRSLIQPTKRLYSNNPAYEHRFLSNQDTVIMHEGTWIGGIPGEKP